MWDKIGFLRIRRKIIKNFLWKKRRKFSEAEAWIDLIMGASWKDEPIRLLGKDYLNLRGCIHTTQTFLANRWDWERTKVSKFLLKLRNSQMIGYRRLGIISIIELLNYDKFNEEEDATATARLTARPTAIEDAIDNAIDNAIVFAKDGAIDIPMTAKSLDDVVAIEDAIDNAIDNATGNATGNATATARLTARPTAHKKEKKIIREIIKIKEINKEKIASFPQSVRDDVMQFIILDIIIYLNAKSSKKFKTSSISAVNFIPERIREGYSLGDLYMLVDYYIKEWIEGRTTADVINPERLFRQQAMRNMINPEEAGDDEASKKKRAREIELIKQVLDHLNKKTHRVDKMAYLYSTPEYQNQILARYAEGYKLEDFKRVIEVKVAEWMGNTKMEVYLRPTTLFGPRFKDYVKQKPLKIPRYRQMTKGQKLGKTKGDDDFE